MLGQDSRSGGESFVTRCGRLILNLTRVFKVFECELSLGFWSLGIESAAGQVKAMFNYTKDVDQLTEIYFYESEKAKGVHEPGDDPREMVVTEGVSDLFLLFDAQPGYCTQNALQSCHYLSRGPEDLNFFCHILRQS